MSINYERYLSKFIASAFMALCTACSQEGAIPVDDLIGCWTAKGAKPYEDNLTIYKTGKFNQKITNANINIDQNGHWSRFESSGWHHVIFNGISVSYVICLQSQFICGIGSDIKGRNNPWRTIEWPSQPTKKMIGNAWVMVVNDDVGHYYSKVECVVDEK